MPPWDKYAAGSAAKAGPWGKYSSPSKAYEDATANASAMSLKGKVADLPSERPSFGDEVMSFGRGVIEGIPIAGPALADARRGLDANIGALATGADADELKAGYEQADEELRAKTGGARAAGGLTGGVLSLAGLGATPIGGTLLGMTGSTGARIGMGMASGGAISGADTLARGGTLEDAGVAALAGGALGGVLPAIGGVARNVGQKVAQNKAITSAIKGAPAASELKDAARAMFQQVDQAGVTIDTPKFGQFVGDLVTKAKKMRINPDLDQNATGAYRSLSDALQDVQTNGGALTMSDMHTLRQIAQKAATSAEGRDAFFANQIVDGIDSFISQPGSAVVPPNLLGTGSAGGADTLKEAISTWGRARRVGVVEEAIEKAKNAASGFENGLRVEFRKILNNKKLRGQFDETELKEMARVVQGTATANAAKLLGKFGFGPGANGLGGFLGGTAGLTMGGPVGAVLAAAGASGARKVSEKLTEAAAERAAKVVATPNIPKIAARAAAPELLAPAVLPLEATKKRQPVEITIGTRGL